MGNVSQIVKDKLCTSCGICKGICLVDAIDMTIDLYGIYTPKIEKDRCINCGLCLKACPGREFDYVHYMKKIHGNLPNNIAIGPVIETYAGYVEDKCILDVSQSGGFISTLLIYGIENRLFDGAVVTRWDEDDPFKPKVYIARNREEVLKAVGSKYNPIPVAAIASEIASMDGSYVFVGTPCQIQGMRKAEEHMKGLSEKITLYIGLHCLKVFNYHYHDQILHKIKKSKQEIDYFQFRDKEWRGWPGDMLLRTKNGETINLAGAFSRKARSYFSNWRCQLCFDKFNEFSDISCGDCRIPSHYGEKTINEAYYNGIGKSDIVVRTVRAKHIIDRMIKDDVLIVEKSSVRDLIKSVAVAEKKIGTKYAMDFVKGIGGKAPNYGVGFDVYDYRKDKKYQFFEGYSKLVAGHYYLCHCLMKYRLFRLLLKITPHKLLGKIADEREKYSNQSRYKREEKLQLVITNEFGKKTQQ